MEKIKKIFRGWNATINWYFLNHILSNFPSRSIRKFVLRKMGVKIGKNVSIFAGFHIRGQNLLKIGSGCSIGPKVLLDARRGLTIGENVTISYETIIWTLHHNYNDELFPGFGAEVTVGDYAWICSRAMILPGIHIGKGAVIASGAVVTKDVGEFEIWGGVPAKLIGHREKKEYKYVPGISTLHMV